MADFARVKAQIVLEAEVEMAIEGKVDFAVEVEIEVVTKVAFVESRPWETLHDHSDEMSWQKMHLLPRSHFVLAVTGRRGGMGLAECLADQGEVMPSRQTWHPARDSGVCRPRSAWGP